MFESRRVSSSHLARKRLKSEAKTRPRPNTGLKPDLEPELQRPVCRQVVAGPRNQGSQGVGQLVGQEAPPEPVPLNGARSRWGGDPVLMRLWSVQGHSTKVLHLDTPSRRSPEARRGTPPRYSETLRQGQFSSPFSRVPPAEQLKRELDQLRGGRR